MDWERRRAPMGMGREWGTSSLRPKDMVDAQREERRGKEERWGRSEWRDRSRLGSGGWLIRGRGRYKLRI